MPVSQAAQEVGVAIVYAPYVYEDGARWATWAKGRVMCAACDGGTDKIAIMCAPIDASKESPGIAYVTPDGAFLHYRCAPIERKHRHDLTTDKDDKRWYKAQYHKPSKWTADNGDTGTFLYIGAQLGRERNIYHLIPWELLNAQIPLLLIADAGGSQTRGPRGRSAQPDGGDPYPNLEIGDPS